MSDVAAVVAAAIATILGSGGVWAWLTSRHRPKIDRAAAEQAAETTAVTNALEVAKGAAALAESLRGEVARLADEVEDLRAELRAERSRYRIALDHLRALTRWIAQHMPAGVPAPPTPPTPIADDL